MDRQPVPSSSQSVSSQQGLDKRQEEEGLVLATIHQDSRAQILTLNRSAKRNALSQPMIDALLTQLKIASDDSNIQTIIITGSGGFFSAGADIKEISALDGAAARQRRYLEDLCHGMQLLSKPVIAAVEGRALGGGFELALMCDFIVAANDVRFGLPEISIGLIPGAGGTQRVTSALGKHRASSIILLNEPLPSPEAHRCGLVCALVDPGKAIDGAVDIATRLANYSQPILAIAKEAIRRADDLGRDDRFERELYYAAFSMPDKEEGVAAFLEKRTPVWRS